MTLHFENTETNLIQANQELARTLDGKQLWSRFRRFRVIAGGCLGLMVWTSLVMGRMPAPQSLFWLAALIGGGCVLFRILDSVVRSRDIRVSIRRAIRLREGKGILGEYSYELTQDGLVTRSTLGTETCFWSAVESIVETPGYIFLRTSKLDYLLIPKHAFSSPQHQAEFLAQVESFRLGQNAPPTPLKSAWYQSKDQT